jgi:phage terminase small subunit
MAKLSATAEAAKVELFAREYIVDFNGAAAAIRAGLPKRSARQRAHEMLQRDDVQARIGELLRVRAKEADLAADDVIGQYKAIALADITDVVSWCNDVETSADGKTIIMKGVVFSRPSHELPPHVRAAIKAVKQTANGVQVEMHDKGGALAKLEAYLRMEGAVQTHRLVGHDNGPIQATTRVIFEVVDPASPASPAAGE